MLDTVKSALFQFHSHARKFWNEHHVLEGVPFITVGLLAGTICCLYALVFSAVEHQAFNLIETNPEYYFLISPVFLIISYLIVRWISPGSSGSGIPQVMISIEKSHSHLAHKLLSKRVIIVKIVSSLAAIFAGAGIGREGPSLQIAAAVSHMLEKMFRKLKIKVRSDQLIIAGAASGLAAAFNTPIGGIVYAVEELTQEHVRSFKDVLLLSVVISGITAQAIMGNYLFLGYPVIQNQISVTLIVVVCCTAILTGLIGASFSKCLIWLMKWRSSKRFTTQVLIAVGVGLLIALSINFFGPRSSFSGKETIHHVLYTQGDVSYWEGLSRFLIPLFSSMLGIAGGIFAPALSAGSAIGGYLSQFFDPSYRTLLALTGMIGFLTGVTRTPITAFILVLEMTDRHSAIFPMMLSSVFASLGAYLVGDKSYYEETVEMMKESYNQPILEESGVDSVGPQVPSEK